MDKLWQLEGSTRQYLTPGLEGRAAQRPRRAEIFKVSCLLLLCQAALSPHSRALVMPSCLHCISSVLSESFRTWVDHLAGQASIVGGQGGVGSGQPTDSCARSRGGCSERGELTRRRSRPWEANVIDVALLRVAGVGEIVSLHRTAAN